MDAISVNVAAILVSKAAFVGSIQDVDMICATHVIQLVQKC